MLSAVGNAVECRRWVVGVGSSRRRFNGARRGGLGQMSVRMRILLLQRGKPLDELEQDLLCDVAVVQIKGED